MNKLGVLASTVTLLALTGSEATAATPEAVNHTLEEVALGNFGNGDQPLTAVQLGVLCQYNQVQGSKMTSDCTHLTEGAKVVFPRDREFDYLMCDAKTDATDRMMCKLGFGVLSASEETNSLYTALDSSHQACVQSLRSANVLEEFQNLVIAARMLRAHDKSEGWEKACKGRELQATRQHAPRMTATLSTSGWMIESHLAN